MDSIALLQTLLQRAEAERDNALAVMRQAEAQMRAAEAQAEQLRNYRSEYDQRWTLRFRQSGGGTRELLQCHQTFGLRLEEAITHQANSTSQAGSRLQRARDLLLQREQRVAAVRKLIERREQELGRMAQRREQRADDEMAMRQHQRRLAMQG
jgi:flagellar FliJ protein